MNSFKHFALHVFAQGALYCCATVVFAQPFPPPTDSPPTRPVYSVTAPPWNSAQSPSLDPETEVIAEGSPATEKFQQLITDLARQHIPHDFVDKRKWGMTDDRWDGIKFERDGVRIETRRRKKEVNHGTWKMYSAELVNPDKLLTLRIENLRRREDSLIEFDLEFSARLNVHGRVSKWVKGVQLYSLSADAIADVKLTVQCLLDAKLDFTKLPPDLVLVPEVVDADLELVEFRLIRVSKAGGELAEQMGKAAQKILEEKIEEKEDKLVQKANAAIAKKKDELRLSVADLMKSKWANLAEKLLPEETLSQISD
jgi:hypothetical protein